MKHIEIKIHYIRDTIEKGKMLLDKVHTDDNPADMLTKSLPTPKFEHCSKFIDCFEFMLYISSLREMHLLRGGFIL